MATERTVKRLAESVPTLELHAAGTGPFAGYDVRLKRHYVRRG